MLSLTLTDSEADVDAAALSDAEALNESATLWLALVEIDADVDAAALSDADALNESATL